MDWIGLDLKNWTHVQLCCAMSETGHVMKADQNEKLVAEETTASKQGNPNRRRQSCCAARPAGGRQHRLPTDTLTVGLTTVALVSSVRDLSIFVDSDLVMCTHVCQTVSRCFAALRQLRSIRHLVSATVIQSLVAALVISRLDYGNCTSLVPTSWVDFSRSRTQRHGSYSGSVFAITSLTLSSVYAVCTVVSVAQLVARRTHDRKVVGSIPTNAVCFTVVR